MKLTAIDVHKMTNLADRKLKEYINSFKHKTIIINDILIKAEGLKRDAALNKNTLLAQKFEDLIESVTAIKEQLQTAHNE